MIETYSCLDVLHFYIFFDFGSLSLTFPQRTTLNKYPNVYLEKY